MGEVARSVWASPPFCESLFSTDDIAALMEFEFEWSDVFDIDVSPAVSAEEGLRIGAEVFGRLKRLQQ